MVIGIVEELKKDGQSLSCKIEVLEDNTIFEFPYTYYPGYTITLNGVEMNSFESENGLLAVSLNKIPKSDITVRYTGTRIMDISKILSIIGIILFILYILFGDLKIQDKINRNRNNCGQKQISRFLIKLLIY